MLVLYLITLKISKIRGEIKDNEYTDKIDELKLLPNLISKTLKNGNKISFK